MPAADAMPPSRSPGLPSRRPTPLRRRLQLRAAIDALFALLLVAGSLLLSQDPHTQLRMAILAAAFGLLAFMIRRSRDLASIRADHRARDAVFAGRGISIAQWHAGQPLAPWRERRAAAGESDS